MGNPGRQTREKYLHECRILALTHRSVKWAQDGTWAEVNRRLGEQTRVQRGRVAQPTGALIESESSKTTEAGGERGFDGGNKGAGAQTA